MTPRKLPIGIQDFVGIRQDGYLYVDKTALIHQIVNTGRSYFLSRPRRFGKSLLLSTLGAYLEGRRELFSDLAIESLEKAWTVYPVLRLDLNAEHYDSTEALEAILESHIRKWETLYGSGEESSIARRFLSVIEKAHAKTGQRVAILIDEYDKPILMSMGSESLHSEYKLILKSFYGVLKSADAHLKFAILTGVTKFGQVSVFSDLNQLIDLTIHPDYATLCGITEEELVGNFVPEMETLARANNMSPEAALEKTRLWYNGYKFHHNAVGVYNPFSTLNLFARREFEAFWFATGTPTFLVELLKKSDYDLRDIDNVQLPAEDFADYRAEADRPIPVIYQSGYLTIKDYEPSRRLYTLGFPNAEVKYGFLNFLAQAYAKTNKDKTGFYIGKFADEVEAGKPEEFLARLQTFFSSFNYELNDKTERHYQVVFYLVFKLMGQFVDAEVRSAIGRADAVVSCADYVYVFEFKLSGSAEDALKQIDDKAYLLPYAATGKTLFKIGVAFNKRKRTIGKWVVERVEK